MAKLQVDLRVLKMSLRFDLDAHLRGAARWKIWASIRGFGVPLHLHEDERREKGFLKWTELVVCKRIVAQILRRNPETGADKVHDTDGRTLLAAIAVGIVGAERTLLDIIE